VITHSLGQLQPTAKGRKMAGSPEFATFCQQIATKVILAEQSYEILESRLRAATIKMLLPQRSYSPEEIADFYRVHFGEVDQIWRSHVSEMMTTIDSDRTGTLEKVLGITIPKQS
jgi:hypothetical protein